MGGGGGGGGRWLNFYFAVTFTIKNQSSCCMLSIIITSTYTDFPFMKEEFKFEKEGKKGRLPETEGYVQT